MPTSLTFDVLSMDDFDAALTHHDADGPLWSAGDPPTQPGVYVWSTPDTHAVCYVGSAVSLSRRLGDERSWIDGHDPETSWSVTVVEMLRHLDAEVHWRATADHRDALNLERRLIEWHRAMTKTAPLLVGWDAKPGSRRGEAEKWARELWISRHSAAVLIDPEIEADFENLDDVHDPDLPGQ